jgi:hypothetical protein
LSGGGFEGANLRQTIYCHTGKYLSGAGGKNLKNRSFFGITELQPLPLQGYNLQLNKKSNHERFEVYLQKTAAGRV